MQHILQNIEKNSMRNNQTGNINNGQRFSQTVQSGSLWHTLHTNYDSNKREGGIYLGIDEVTIIQVGIDSHA